jgi:hypothetical protein
MLIYVGREIDHIELQGQRRLNSSLYLEQGIGFICEDELSYNHQSRY